MTQNTSEVFLSFSGELSKKIATKLKEIIKHLEISNNVFFSDDNIKAGDNWLDEINASLKTSRVCIILFTKENINNKWLYLEYGAFSYKKHADIPKKIEVIPAYIDFESNNWPENPLKHYQAISLIKKGVKNSIIEILIKINEVFNVFVIQDDDSDHEKLKQYINTKLEKTNFYQEIEAILQNNSSLIFNQEQNNNNNSHEYTDVNEDINLYSKVLIKIADFFSETSKLNNISAEYDELEKFLIKNFPKTHEIMLSINYLETNNYIEFYKSEGMDSYPVEYLRITLKGQKTIRRRKNNKQ